MVVKSIILKDWAICGTCGAKLFRIYNKATARNIEIKCHQCKSINKVEVNENVRQRKSNKNI